jgi:hypothetical protein
MIIGRTPVPLYDFQITCAYSGCATKTMSVDANIAGMKVPLSFGGLTEPYFEDAYRTKNNGADLHPESVLRVRWKRLEFFGQHRLLGRVEIRMLTEKSTGRVESLARSTRLLQASWLADSLPPANDSFFPAINENRLYFRISLPRFGLEFENYEPAVNGAVINQILPLSTLYTLQSPVKFTSTSRLAPFSMTLEKCRMAMAILQNIALSVGSLTKTGDWTTRLIVKAKNESSEPHVRLAVRPYSASNIEVQTEHWSLDVDQQETAITFNIDISKAMPASTVYIAFMIIEPFENQSANTLMLDYEEIRAGHMLDGYPQISQTATITADMHTAPHR